MKKKRKIGYCIAAGFLAAFVIWTVLVQAVDVKPIGPQGSLVGFSTLNGSIHAITGVNMALYTVTDWLGLVPIAVALSFGLLGLLQWIKRRSIRKVDRAIVALGIFYIAVIAAYALFEYVVVNYRPVLIEGRLEVSYPSSTTLLSLTVMPAGMIELWRRIEAPKPLRNGAVLLMGAFSAFMVVGRFLSGVHWFTDIVGGALLSTALVCAYAGMAYKNSV